MDPALFVRLAAVTLVAATLVTAADGSLSPSFYDATCPGLQQIVRAGMAGAVQKEARMGASVLRLFFHDCFINGCDASVLLDDTATFTGEKSAEPNARSLRGFDIIDGIKAQVEAACTATASCADILALAARDAVNLLGGPTWTVLLGRTDALTASKAAAENNLPSPDSTLAQLLASFGSKGLDARDLAALSGAHTIGVARCSSFRSHIYNDKVINATFAVQVRANCPLVGGDDNVSPLELQQPDKFDNGYFSDVITRRALLGSDQQLFSSNSSSNGATDALVQEYAGNAATFMADFANAMIKMGDMPLIGDKGEVRLNCRRRN